MMRRLFYFLPLIVFAGLAAFLAAPLLTGKDPRVLSSVLVGREAPGLDVQGFELPRHEKGMKLVNFFASWCVPCAAEQPILSRMQKDGVAVYGVAYKDKPEAVKNFLARYGNPYHAVGFDDGGRGAINWGVYGVPETFLIKDGRILKRHAGPLTEKDYLQEFKPLLEGGAK